MIFSITTNKMERDEMQEMNLQLALFFKDIENRPDDMWYKIDGEIKELIPGVPTITPLPAGTPVDFPIVQAKSKDGIFTVNVSKSRIDLIIHLLSTDITMQRKNELVKNFAKNIHSLVEISRVGISETVIFGEIFPGAKKISEKYFAGTQSDAIELSIRKNVISNVSGLDCNNIFDISSVPLIEKDGQATDGFVKVLRDINNVEKKETLSLDSIDNIIEYGLNELSEEKLKELVI